MHLRSEQEMMNLFLNFAAKEDRIRLVTMEGSRTNVNIPPDSFQDFDISYFVTDMDFFKENDEWLGVFGKRIMMQKPEDMELFPPELGNWFSYIMLFEDGNKLDLTLIPVNESELYFAESDGLVKVLLDKDRLVKNEATATDRGYWLKKPSAREFDDCCNEFWMVSTYVVKGLARQEILFAIDHLNEIARPNLLRMMAWNIGSVHGYTFSVGKTINLSTAICRAKIGKHCCQPITEPVIRKCGGLCLLVTICLENTPKRWRKALGLHTRIMMKPLRNIPGRFMIRCRKRGKLFAHCPFGKRKPPEDLLRRCLNVRV
ncbi:hypothetical protein HMSSN036_33490 [Paenibacillus macerans]|nr:hypothetical protein HMSSN036_33490 [Paenibacillus macerans]